MCICFKASGQFSCDGVSVAIHEKNHEIARPSAEKAWKIFDEIRISEGFPLIIE